VSLTKEKEKQAMEVMKRLKGLILSAKEFGHKAFENEAVDLAEWFLLLVDGHDVVPMYTSDKEFIAMNGKLIGKIEDIEKSLNKGVRRE